MSIHFDENTHTYTRDGQPYISVTTLIGKYVPVFDSDYWATYKAVKDVLSSYWEWSDYKWNAGGWESVVDYFRRNGAGAYDNEIYEQKQYYLDLWDYSGQEARDKGTLVHRSLEEAVLNGTHQTHADELLLKPSQMELLELQEFTGNGAFPELKVFNDTYRIAGMVDLVRKAGHRVHITDYKTSKEISVEAFRDEKLLPPLHHIPNADYYKFTMQVSLYAWMLEQCGFDIGELVIEHRDRDTGDLIKAYPLEYRKRDVLMLLQDYAEI